MDLMNPSFALLLWTFLAFIIVFFILKKYAWKPILKSLKERENGINEAISSAEKVKAEMAQLKSENENLLVKAHEERALMVKEAKHTSDKMISDAKDKAKAEYERIVAETQHAIQQQKNAALIERKKQVGKLVIEVAEKVLRQELADKNEQENYIKQLAEGVKLN